MSVGVEERAVVRNAGWAIVVVMLADEAKRRDLGAARVETPAAMGRGRRGTAETTAEQATSKHTTTEAIQEENEEAESSVQW